MKVGVAFGHIFLTSSARSHILSLNCQGSGNVMRLLIANFAAFAVLLAELPHVFCGCGCTGLAGGAALAASDEVVPCCRGHGGGAGQEDNRGTPCRCRGCGVIYALPAGAGGGTCRLPVWQQTWSGKFAGEVSFGQWKAAGPSPARHQVTWWAGAFPGMRCTLSVVLGHLLL